MKKDSGFIQIIILIVIFVVVALYLGKNPVAIWEGIRPLFERALDFFVSVVDFLVRFMTGLWQNS